MDTPAPSRAARRTPLYEYHVALHARMAPFGGFEMPIQYTGILQEHEACRRAVAIFDTCHMGEFFLSGATALADLEHLVSCDVSTLAIGQCRYGLLCNPDGGVRDDLIVYRLAETSYMVVVNAGTQDADFAWFTAHASTETTLANRSDTTAKLDIQGPGTPKLLQGLLAQPFADMRYYRFQPNTFAGQPVLLSRTGYTGEIGFEVYSDHETARQLWKACLAAGALPAGLGARDTLRLEAGMPLYGHELSEARNAAESGFTAAIAKTKNFVGAAAIRNAALHRQQRVGLALDGRRAARAGDRIQLPDGKDCGVVTSGSFAPSVGHAIALGYVENAHATPANAFMIQTARDRLPATLVPTPFYPHGTARRPTTDFL